MNIGCPNCNKFKTRRKRSFLFWSIRIFFPLLIIAMGVPILWLVLIFLLLFNVYQGFKNPEAFNAYICKSCGFEFIDKKDEEEVEVKDLRPNYPSEKVISEATDLVKEGNVSDAVRLIKINTSLSLEECKNLMNENGFKDLRPNYPSEKVLRRAKVLVKNNKIDALRLIKENTNLGLKESKDIVDDLSADNDNKT
jgi:transposase-like protein